jgi:hypothetical protein
VCLVRFLGGVTHGHSFFMDPGILFSISLHPTWRRRQGSSEPEP